MKGGYLFFLFFIFLANSFFFFAPKFANREMGGVEDG